MSLFSERMGYQKPRADLGESQMPDSSKNGLWDVMTIYCFNDIHGDYTDYSEDFEKKTAAIWFGYLHEARDTKPDDPQEALARLRSLIFSPPFYKAYDFLEYSIKKLCKGKDVAAYVSAINHVFERERAAFRVIENLLVPITNDGERIEIESAISSGQGAVSKHILRAAELYAARPDPDYRNSVKEAISAVEAAVAKISGSRPGGISKPLRKVLDDNVLHPALRDGFEKLYAYSSDADGIRHALLDDGRSISQEDARYMLISCSAFSNYLLAIAEKSRKR